jgi:hypothetical protein
MDTLQIAFAVMAATLALVTFVAWRQGNERRDIVLLGSTGGLMGLGAALTAALA